ncbi:hypothetical protein K469DRAFT_636494 [Zopfia rhizophila CBS 207.26]|uniref:Uncharacterized protein n=1 Tax=Zopfia rhizophila CBS 207.26 TaxID=1314779 RepID=A0A6A6DSF3_9PEZI|nr:hypothetical protein K469DRAFT_636494 [Zopfia rhizophila CBS 207.26]
MPSSTSENHHHAQYTYIPKMENMLPRSRSKIERPLPSTPRRERSMADSFIIEHNHPQQQTPQRPVPDLEDTHSPTPPLKNEPLTPLSNWAHLSLIKNQRNSLNSELKAQQVAGAEAKASVAALRRLAFRLAVNISVKEKKIANTARNLAHSRKKGYMSTRDAEKRIEELTKSWKAEERRNREILESLERAAMLTLQYASPNPQPQNRLQPNPLSPPPSPPTRVSSLAYQQPSTPKTPTHSPSSSISWTDGSFNYSPGRGSLVEIRTSNDRLIRAKRESDHALLVCRSRIEALQADCLRSKESARVLEMTRLSLEEDIQGYQARVSALENSKVTVEETLRDTQSKLDDSVKSETELRAELELKNQEIAQLEQQCRQGQENIRTLEESKALLEGQVNNCTAQIQKLEAYTTGLEDELRRAQSRLDAVEHREVDLQQKLAENESHRAGMETQLEKSRANITTLEKAGAFFEAQVKEYNDKIQAFQGEVSWLNDGLKNSEELKERVDGELATARLTMSELESNLGSATEINASLQMDLGCTRIAKAELEKDLKTTKDKLANETDLRAELQSEVDSLRLLKGNLEQDLENAYARINTLYQPNPEIQQELETLRTARTSIEEQLRASQQSSSDLQRELQTSHDKLASMEASMGELQARLKQSEESRLGLADEVHNITQSKTEAEDRLTGTLKSKASLEHDLTSTRSRLLRAETEGANLHAKLSVADIELDALRRTNADLEKSEKHLLSRLTTAEKELGAVRRANEELEAFLEQAEQDMIVAEATVEESSKQLDAFVDESNAKLSAAQRSNMKYKRRLSVKGKELETLKDENSDLHYQIEQKEQDIESLKSSESRLQAELQIRDATIEELQKSKSDFAASVDAIEEELRILRESKRTFEQVVSTLQEKTRHMEVLAEWEQPADPNEAAGWLNPEGQDHMEGFTPSPTIQRILHSRPGTARSKLSGEPEIQRFTSRGTVRTTEEDLQTWAKEVERVRMLRDETAVQLKGMKKVKSSLKKTLKASEAQLESLEKKQKLKTHHTFLSKRKVSSVILSPFKPSPTTLLASRPTTAPMEGKEPVGTPNSENGDWENIPPPIPYSASRPGTSFGRLMVKRPNTRGSEGPTSLSPDRRGWSGWSVFRRGRKSELSGLRSEV